MCSCSLERFGLVLERGSHGTDLVQSVRQLRLQPITWCPADTARNPQTCIHLLGAHTLHLALLRKKNNNKEHEGTRSTLYLLFQFLHTRISLISLSPSSRINFCLFKSGSSTGGLFGVKSLIGEDGRGLEGEGAESDLARSHISQWEDGVWLA